MALLKAIVSDALKAEVAAQAKVEQRTIKAVVVRALERYLDEAKAKHEAA